MRKEEQSSREELLDITIKLSVIGGVAAFSAAVAYLLMSIIYMLLI